MEPADRIDKLLKRLFLVISHARRRELSIVLLCMLASSLAETISITLVLPLLTVLAQPNSLFSQPLLEPLWLKFGIVEARQLLIPVTCVFVLAAIVAALVQLITLRLSLGLAAKVGSDLSVSAFSRCLSQPYDYHLSTNSARLVSVINNSVNTVIGNVLNPLLRLTGSSLTIIAVAAAVIALSPLYSLGLLLIVFLVYLILASFCRRPLVRLSQRQLVSSRLVIQYLQEGFGAIRDVLLDGTKDVFVDSFSTANMGLRSTQAGISYVAGFPRVIVELLALIIFALIGCIVSLQGGGVSGALPLIGLFALSAQRLLPFAQKVYDSWSLVVGSRADLTELLYFVELPETEVKPLGLTKLSFCTGLQFQGIGYQYSPEKPYVLYDLTFTIRPGERVGLIGATGSGKSTTLDLMMGLLKPSRGHILVDGLDIHGPGNGDLLWRWRETLAHVPQSIYLSDQSVAQNIALGVPEHLIDHERVKYAASQAQALSFVESLPHGFSTSVGERGVQLSGGQRQRLGIARALYKEAKVLILDEATSALDSNTESSVMAAIEKLPRNLTLVIVAHRTESLGFCDRILDVSSLSGRTV